MLFISITESISEYLNYFACLVFELSKAKILSRNYCHAYSTDVKQTNLLEIRHIWLGLWLKLLFIRYLYENRRFNCYFCGFDNSYFVSAIFVPLRGAQTWRRHTFLLKNEFYKTVNIFAKKTLLGSTFLEHVVLFLLFSNIYLDFTQGLEIRCYFDDLWSDTNCVVPYISY